MLLSAGPNFVRRSSPPQPQWEDQALPLILQPPPPQGSSWSFHKRVGKRQLREARSGTALEVTQLARGGGRIRAQPG